MNQSIVHKDFFIPAYKYQHLAGFHINDQLKDIIMNLKFLPKPKSFKIPSLCDTLFKAFSSPDYHQYYECHQF